MRVRVGAATDVGLVRSHNEDAYLAAPPLFAVADGLGGHRGGEVAASLAIEVLAREGELDGQILAERVREANRVVLEASLQDRALAGMGTTLTAALQQDRELHLAHVGDSRAYLLRDGEFRLLTEDHTLVHRMVKEGQITEAEADLHPQRSILTRALGIEPDIEVDRLSTEVRDRDRILLCTDGLTTMLQDQLIRDILERMDDPQAAADHLVETAVAAGGVDNVTVVVLHFEADDGDEQPEPTQTAETVGGAAAPAAPAGPAERRPRLGGAGRPTGAPERGQGPRGRAARERPSALLVWTTAILVLVTLALAGVRLSIDQQWFVGVDDGRVAVFRGIPSTVAGVRLYRVVAETDIVAEDAKLLAVWSELDDGITADSRSDAMSIVEQIRRDLAAGQGSPAR